MRLLPLIVVASMLVILTGCESTIAFHNKAFYPKGYEPRQDIYGPGYHEQPGVSVSRGFQPIGGDSTK